MKKLLIASIVFMALNSQSQQICKTKKPCKIVSKEVVSESADDVNTPTPKELEGAVYIVRTKDGKEHKMSAKTFKVVKRQQQYKNKEKVILEHIECEPKILVKTVTVTKTIVKKERENRNIVMLGVRYDFVRIDGGASADGSSAYLEAKRSTVLDVSYFRRNILDSSIGVGVGIDTNGTPRGVIGLEF
jgi:hypothetical protein